MYRIKLFLVLSTLYLVRNSASSSDCAIYDDCLNEIESIQNTIVHNINATGTIALCKQLDKGLPLCFESAEKSCTLDRTQKRQYKKFYNNATITCDGICSIITEVKTCADSIDYNILLTSTAAFCKLYIESFDVCMEGKWKNTTCPVGREFFEGLQDEVLGSDAKSIAKYICRSGCDDIDAAMAILEECYTSNKGNTCREYYSIVSCIQKAEEKCKEARIMMLYYNQDFWSMEDKCHQTTESTIPLTTLITQSTIRSTLSTLRPDTTESNITVPDTRTTLTTNNVSTTVKKQSPSVFSTENVQPISSTLAIISGPEINKDEQKYNNEVPDILTTLSANNVTTTVKKQSPSVFSTENVQPISSTLDIVSGSEINKDEQKYNNEGNSVQISGLNAFILMFMCGYIVTSWTVIFVKL